MPRARPSTTHGTHAAGLHRVRAGTGLPIPVQNSVKVADLTRFVSLGGPNNTRYFFSVDAARFRAVASVVNFRMASLTVILSSSGVSTVPETSMSRTTSLARSQFVRSRLLRTGSPATVPWTQIGHEHRRYCLPFERWGHGLSFWGRIHWSSDACKSSAFFPSYRSEEHQSG